MSKNAEALKFIRSVGQTYGFATEVGDKGRYKLIRLAIRKYGVERATITVSSHSANQQHANNVTRARKDLGWTQGLYEEMEEIERTARIKNEDAEEPLLMALLTALGINPDADPETEETPRQAQQRHGKGGTATGSVRARAGAAQPAPPPREAPVELLEGAGRMQAERITPERALDLLMRMAPYQRKEDEKKVREYAAAMLRGEWKLNPADPLCIDTNDMTANGRHRLRACVEAEVEFLCWVAYDTPPEVYDVMDRGKRRTTADMLYGAGETNSTRLAALASFAHLWFNHDQDQWSASLTSTEAQKFAVIEAHPRLRDSTRNGLLTKLRVSSQASMLAHYLISRKMGGDDRLVTEWYKAIQTMDLQRGQPGHTLGLYYMGTATSRRKPLKNRPRRELDMYLIMQAWNNTCLGKEVRSVSYSENFVIAQPLAPTERHTFPDFG